MFFLILSGTLPTSYPYLKRCEAQAAKRETYRSAALLYLLSNYNKHWSRWDVDIMSGM